MIVAVLQVLLLVPIGSYVIWTVLTHVCTWYYFARHARRLPLTGYEPPVSIIKPTKGVDQSALDNFRSFCKQEYGSDYELLFCVEEQSDPSVPLIKRIIEEYPNRKIRLIFSDPKDTRSIGKLKNMIAGFEESSYEIIIFSDSDAHVPPNFLKETVACTKHPEIGLGFGAPAYAGAEDWAAALRSVSVNELVLRLTTMHLFGLFDGAVGTTMVMRKEVIEQIGGLEQFGWQLADDFQLAKTIRKQGYQIHLLKQPARVFHHYDSFKEWWAHLHRWLVTIRLYWPVHFLLMSLADLALWWGLLYLGISLFQHRNIPIGIALVLIVLATSLISTTIVNLRFVHNKKLWRFLWVVLIQELLRLPLILHSCLTNEIVWRGRRFRIDPDCTMRIVETRKAAHDNA
jgi:ceramide glucosyltransferase